MKREYAKQEDIPASLQEEYEEKDGKWVLKLEGEEDLTSLKAALARERKSKTDLDRELKALKDRLGDLDPDKAREAMQKLQEMADKKLIDEGKLEELLSARTDRMKGDYENQVKAFKTQNEQQAATIKELNDKLAEILIDGAITEAALKSGVKKTALPDMKLRGRQVYVMENGAPVPKREGNIIYGKDPNKPMSPEEWVGSLVSEAPHLFEVNSGGGSGGGAGNNGARGGQVVLTREESRDPVKYRAAKEQAAKAGTSVVVN